MTAATSWKQRIIGLTHEDPASLLAHPLNPKHHPGNQRTALRAALDSLGWIAACTQNDRTNTIIDGHARIEEALSHGEPTVPVIHVDLSPEEEALALLTLDPIGAMFEADKANMDALLRQVETDSAELQRFLSEQAEEVGLNYGAPPVEAPEPQIDRAAELQEKWGTAQGQIWIAGRHRLLVGDSTNDAEREALVAGARVNLLHTDPPYGINIVRPKGLAAQGAVGGSKPFGATSGVSRRSSTGFDSARPAALGSVPRGPKSRNQIIQSNLYPVIEGDDKPFEPDYLLDLAPITILWGANYYADKLPPSSCWLCWDKREGVTRNSFADCELAWCSDHGPARVFHHLWNGLHKGSQYGERRTHPTEKPVALFEEIGRDYAEAGIWLDLYAGTGAQIVAAERSGATCLAAEIEPSYCAVILERLSQMGLEPHLEGA